MGLLKGLLNWIVLGWSLLLAASYLGFLGTRWLPHNFFKEVAFCIFVLAGFAVVSFSLLPFWDRRAAGKLGVWGSLPIAFAVVGYVALLSETAHWKHLAAIAAIAACLAVPAVYWKTTEAREWPLLTSKGWRALAAGVTGMLTLLLGCVITILIAVHTPEFGDCDSTARPYAAQRSDGHVVVVARVIHTSLLLGTVAVVDDHYWGLPWWNRKLLFFRPVPFWKEKLLFIDARRQGGLLSRLIPVLYFTCGSRTKLVANAEIDFRVLRDGPQPGFRIIGSVGTYRDPEAGQIDPRPGVVVEATSGNNKFSATTDEHGIFDFRNLPLGRYQVTAPAAKGWVCDPFPYLWKEIESGDVGECVLHASKKER